MKILVAEDEDANRRGIEVFLKTQGHEAVGARNGKEALAFCQQNDFDLIISDVMMPQLDGLGFLQKLKELSYDIPVIMITAFASIENAVQAMKIGAEDYLSKPLNLEELKIKINKIQNKIDLFKENKKLKEKLSQLEFPDMIGVSKAIKDIQKRIVRVAADPVVAVVIYGESGTGKELVARTIHNRSERSQKPFIAINCAAFQDALLESELFGHKRGAFTGAYHDKKGIFQVADQGTLFLDEISEMSSHMQAKLLRVLQEHTFQPVGSTDTIRVDIRVVGASNKDLHAMVEKELFREDLFYRLNVVEINLPPLRERQEDIALLISHFLEQSNARREKTIKISSNVFKLLQNYIWPGNIRELENLIQMLVVTCEDYEVSKSDLPERITNNIGSFTEKWNNGWKQHEYKFALSQVTQEFEQEYLTYHLNKNLGNISRTADSIGLSRVALHKKIKLLGIKI